MPNATYCNPLNLNYRLQNGDTAQDDPVIEPFREAADPSVVFFEGHYFLFASQSGGYWYSSDLSDWEFLSADETQLPTIGINGCHGWAPTALVLDGYVHILFSQAGAEGELIYRTGTPLRPDTWEALPGTNGMGWDPQFFYDKDTDRVWIVFGCSPDNVITVQELDRRTLVKTGPAYPIPIGDHRTHGWERTGNNNDNDNCPWAEGAQLMKHGGRYYLMYASGTADNSYAGGVYAADEPTGPYTYEPYSPFAQKLTGFINGAGHGEVIRDENGDYWNFTCMNINTLHRFERRVGMYPVCFTRDGQLQTDTHFGDYPLYLDRGRPYETGWQLLSLHCPAAASASKPGRPPADAVNEDSRTWWCAPTGGGGEWLELDLEQVCRVHAVQVNFAEENVRRDRGEDYHQYRLRGSVDGRTWTLLHDRSRNKRAIPHDYAEFPDGPALRYLRAENIHMALEGDFALRGLRVFGTAPGSPPAPVSHVDAVRHADRRNADLLWTASADAQGYIVRFGIAGDRLFRSCKVFGTAALSMRSLNTDTDYVLRVDAFNASGCTQGTAYTHI